MDFPWGPGRQTTTQVGNNEGAAAVASTHEPPLTPSFTQRARESRRVDDNSIDVFPWARRRGRAWLGRESALRHIMPERGSYSHLEFDLILILEASGTAFQSIRYEV